MNTNLLLLIILGGFVGAASGYLGSFMVIKRMSLVGDALSHVALPGIAIAMTFGFNPMIGAVLALLVAIISVWYLSEKTEIYPESLIGIFFTTSLALGILLTPEPEIFEALFGDIDNVSNLDMIAILLGSFVIFITIKLISKKLMLGIVSEDLAKSQKINITKINLVYLLSVALIVALGVKFLGTLLTGALVIIPAVSAKNVAKSMKDYHYLSIIFGIICTSLGLVVAKILNLSSGPIVVLISVAFFFIINFFKNNK